MLSMLPVLSTLLVVSMLLVASSPAPARAVQRPFHLMVFGGVAAGGELYTASTDEDDHIWTSPEGDRFGGERVKTSLDENLFVGLRVGKGIADRFSLNLSVAYTSMNITADVLTSARNADAYNWDQVSATFIDLALNWDWSGEKNAPYFTAGVGWAHLGFQERQDDAFDLDQGGLQFVLGGGYRWGMLQLEARDHVVRTDFGPEEARLAVDHFDGKKRVQFWEISVAVFFDL